MHDKAESPANETKQFMTFSVSPLSVRSIPALRVLTAPVTVPGSWLSDKEYACVVQRRAGALKPPDALSESASAAVTKSHRLGGLNHRRLFSCSSRGWQVKAQGPGDQVLGEGPLLLSSHNAERKLWWLFSSDKGTNLIMGLHSQDLI